MDINKSFDVYLKELSKNQLIDIIKDYNKLIYIFDDEAISYNKKEHLISHVECCQKKFAPPNS